MVDTKKPPYFSTFDEEQKYYRILARPGRPIQAREWNDLQEQIQKQIDRVGAHLFENGAQVLPGNDDAVTYRNNVGFIKLSRSTSPLSEELIERNWLGKTIVSTSSPAGIKAKVIGYRPADTLGEVRLFVDYVQSDESTGRSHTFISGQTLQTDEVAPFSAAVSLDATAVGQVSSVKVQRSVYFFNGDFILIDEQSLFIDPVTPENQASWNNLPTAKIGLSVEKSIVTFQEDEGLGDNATLSDSFGAPGCDRLCITATLAQRDYFDQADGQFIEIVRVSEGIVQERVRYTQYAVLEDTLARRTYDESGDYTVREFPIFVRPFLKDGDNKGVHPRSAFQFSTREAAEEAGSVLFGIRAATPDPDLSAKYLPATSYSEFLRLADGKLTIQVDPGKAYVKGYEIEKLAPTYVDFDKARDLRFQNNRTVEAPLGTFVYVTNMYGIPSIEDYQTVEIHRSRKSSESDLTPGSKIGTAKALAIEYFAGTHGEPTAIYKLYLFDAAADDGLDLSQMKSIASVSGASSPFSADLVLEYAPLEGSVQVGTGNKLVGFGTSFVNKPSQSLSRYDYIRVGNSPFQVYEVLSVENDTSVTLTKTPTFTGNQSIEFAYASFHGLEQARGLLFPLPERNAYTLRSANSDNSVSDIIDTVFYVRKSFDVVADEDAVITIQNTVAGEEFSLFSPSDYIVVDTTTKDWISLTAGEEYNDDFNTAGVELVTTTQFKVYVKPESAGHSFKVLATVKKTGGNASREKTKRLETSSVVTAASRSDLGVINLDEADVFKVTRIVMSPDFTIEPSMDASLPAGHKDITDRYLLDDGQTEYYYGLGSVYLKPGAERPTGRVRVEFDYFSHSPDGNYFSVDSYPTRGATASLDYSDIPRFTDSSGRIYSLRDCLDFRPRVVASGGFANYIEVPRSDVTLDFHHYLNRIDILYLDRFGKFRIARGTPDVIPVPPEVPADGMAIYELSLVAYTASPSECYRKKFENRRYTMRDIGRIAQRVENLEYYTLLSLLEKEAKELEVKDGQGLDRFKNGFIVDNFTGHGIGNVFDPDYRCSVDSTKEELRPLICQKHVSLIEKNSLVTNPVTRESDRLADNYALTGKLYTLKYSPKKFVEQDLASQVENLNPYAKFTFRGRVKLDPATDTWRDTETLPPLQVVDDTAFRAAQAGVNPNEVLWGNWEHGWSKVDVGKKKTKTWKTRGPNPPSGLHTWVWPIWVHTESKVVTTTTTTEIRKGISRSVVDKGYKTQSLGSRVVSTVPADYIRPKQIAVEARGFLPNSRLYAFFNDEPVSVDCKPKNGSLGDPIRADATGSVDLTFHLPAKKFLTGERIFKLTTSATNESDPQPASFGETKYYAVGWIDTVQETELSIRDFEVVSKEVTDTKVSVKNDVKVETKVVREDPIAQSFAITEKGGCFILAVDVFFYSKDPSVPVKLQLRPLSNDGYPTNLILPFGEVVKPAADVITNQVNLTTGKLTVKGNGTIPGYTVGPWNAGTTNPIEIQNVRNKSGKLIPNGSEIALQNAHNDMIPTRFIFESPIFLQENNDYAIVLIADSVEYQVWVAQSGPITARPGGTPVFGRDINTVIGTTTTIMKDNFLNGVFFRSSNGVTWNADQLVDMKFALHKAEFVTNVDGVIEYVNEELPEVGLPKDPILTKAGSRRIRVFHKNHGHPAFASTPPRVVLSGVTSANGLDVALINRPEGWPIESIQLDSYVIHLNEGAVQSAVATASGRTGGSSVTASENISMDAMFLTLHQLNFPDAEVKWSYSTVNGGNVSYQDPNPKALPFAVNAYNSVEPNATIEFPNPMTISSVINENSPSDAIPGPSSQIGLGIGDRKTLRARAILRSSNPNLSPVLDMDRLAAIAVSNRINNPAASGKYSIVTELDMLTVVPTTQSPAVASTAWKIYFYDATTGTNKGKIKTTDPSIAQHLSKLDVGKPVTIVGASGAGRNKTDVLVLSVDYKLGLETTCTVVFDTTFGGGANLDAGNVTITQKDNFVDEIAPQGGVTAFKYISKQLTLARQSTALRISFDANRHVASDIDLYYKLMRTDSNVPFEDVKWIKAEFNAVQSGILSPLYPAPNASDIEFTDYAATINGLPPFMGFALKIVGRGGNSSRPPRISNLKGIALDE